MSNDPQSRYTLERNLAIIEEGLQALRRLKVEHDTLLKAGSAANIDALVLMITSLQRELAELTSLAVMYSRKLAAQSVSGRLAPK